MTLTKTGIFRVLILLYTLLSSPIWLRADENNDTRYERVSLCQFMVSYPHKTYFRELEQEYKTIPLPNNINNHNLGVNFIKFASGDVCEQTKIDHFISNSKIAKRLVSKWFSRKKTDGTFNMSLIHDRGHYNATLTDARIAHSMLRGEAYLADRGERLLNYTFVAVHDFEPTDGELSNRIGFNKRQIKSDEAILNLLDSTSVSEYNKQFHSGDKQRAKYRIKCVTYLYKLVWNEDIADRFYSLMYCESPDKNKLSLFDNDSETFRLEYVGKSEQEYEQKRTKRIKSNEALVKTAMARIMDMNFARLQSICPDFRIKAPLRCHDGFITAEIGMKEDITISDIFEVLEREEYDNGHIRYNIIGYVKPIKNKIWDNRFNAYDNEGFDDAGLRFTSFEKVSGEDFYDGLLIRK